MTKLLCFFSTNHNSLWWMSPHWPQPGNGTPLFSWRKSFWFAPLEVTDQSPAATACRKGCRFLRLMDAMGTLEKTIAKFKSISNYWVFHQVRSDFLFKALFKTQPTPHCWEVCNCYYSHCKGWKSEMWRLRAWSVPIELGSLSALRDWQHQSLCSVQLLLRAQDSLQKSCCT